MTAERMSTATKHPPCEGEVDDLSIVYPDSDGEPMAETDFQYTAMMETTSTLRVWFAGRTDVYVAGDMLMYYRMNDNRSRVAPDIYVVFGAAGTHKRRNWLVWREGKAPDFVMEIASPGTWRRDILAKRHIYAGMGVTEYWWFDPTGECFRPVLGGERLVDGEYRDIPLETGEDGTLWGHSDALRLDICALPDGNLRLYDPESGQWLQTHQEDRDERLMAEAAQRNAEAARQSAETGRQEAEAARQSAEAGRREAEAVRQSVEDKNRRLREQLRRLQSG